MTGFPILDVAIGLAFVYLLLALICTTLMEWWSQRANLRGEMLETATRRLFGEEADPNHALTTAYLQHPLIRSLSDGSRKPSYIPATVFAKALRELWPRTRGKGEGALPVSESLRQSLQALGAASAGKTAADELPSEAALAEWYDQVMERVSGTFKRQARSRVLVLAIGVTLLMNADTVTLTKNLWQNPTLRAYLVEQARVRLEQGPPLESVEYTDPTNPAPTPPVTPDTTRSPNQLLAEEQALLGELFGWAADLPRSGAIGPTGVGRFWARWCGRFAI